jgi:hypothetical protein
MEILAQLRGVHKRFGHTVPLILLRRHHIPAGDIGGA